MKNYTGEIAEIEIGESLDFRDGLKSSLKKWKQIATGNTESYDKDSLCGFCLVAKNVKNSIGKIGTGKFECNCSCCEGGLCAFAIYNCKDIGNTKPSVMLRRFKTKKLKQAIKTCNAIVNSY